MIDQETTAKKSPLRFVFAALASIGALGLLRYLAAWLIGNVFGGISFNVSRAATIGIIGGADGPTAVFVTAATGPVWELLLWILLLAVGIWGFRRFGKGIRK